MSEKLIVNCYDRILLKDGREGCVVEKFSDRDYLVDVGDDEETWETISVTIDDIEKVTWRSKKTEGPKKA